MNTDWLHVGDKKMNWQESKVSQHSPSGHTGSGMSRTGTAYSGSPAEGVHTRTQIWVCMRLLVSLRLHFIVEAKRLRFCHLVKPEIVWLEENLKFGEKLVVVEAINGLHVTSAVIQIAGDLRWIQNTNNCLFSV